MENFFVESTPYFLGHKRVVFLKVSKLWARFQKDRTSWSWKKYPRVSDSKVGQETFGQKQGLQLVPVACWMPCHHNSPPSYHHHANHHNPPPSYHHHPNHHNSSPSYHHHLIIIIPLLLIIIMLIIIILLLLIIKHHLATEGASCTSSQLNALPCRLIQSSDIVLAST